MSQEMQVRATLGDGMSFNVDTGSGYRVVLDAAADFGGHGMGPQPMEMLLVGLAGCSGIDILALLHKMRQQISAYEIYIHAKRAETHPKIFTHITIEHSFTGHQLQPQAIQRALDLDADRYCGVNAMLRASATITHTFQIHEVP